MRKYNNKNSTHKSHKSQNKNKPKTQKYLHKIAGNADAFEREITVRFLEMIIMIKLYHWKTYTYATHIATDDLYSKLNKNMDKFIEVLLGKVGNRINLLKHKSIKLTDFDSSIDDTKKFKYEIVKFKEYLVNLNSNPFMVKMANTDLYNIRDEILGDLNQFLYLFTFK